jgi:hypothetical protein
MAKIVVSGYMVRYPLGGLMLAYFHYLLGFHRLGHRVVYIEESGWPQSCYDPETDSPSSDPQPGLKVVRALLEQHDLPIPVYYVDRATGETNGGTRDDVRRELAESDVLLNLGGVCWLDEYSLCRKRILLDMDPLFTQVDFFANKVLGDYHVHLSYGMNIGRPGCTVPTMDYTWRGTVPPVACELWSGKPPGEVFTTVATWSGYGQLEYQNQTYGQKDVEFQRLIDLPKHTPQPLEIVMSGGEEIRDNFRAAGWSILDSGDITRNLDRYMNYVRGSRGEFSAAKNAYVKTRCGWFSDRTVCYLASSRPVAIQDTGIADWLPTGRGVLTFSTLAEAADCLARINADYETHSRAARELATQYFDYRTVLPRILDMPGDVRA